MDKKSIALVNSLMGFSAPRHIRGEIKKKQKAAALAQPKEIRQIFMDFIKAGSTIGDACEACGFDIETALGIMNMQTRKVTIIDFEVKK